MMAGAPSTLRARIIAMSAPRPQQPILQAALLACVALALVALGASPALARPLASARRALATVFEPVPQDVQPAKVSMITQGVVPAQVPAKGVQGAVPAKGVQGSVPAKGVQGPVPAKAGLDTTAKPAKAFKEFKLDEQAKMAPGSAMPRYPEILKAAGITGSTLVMFVVDTTGRVEESTLKVVRTAHQLFVEAVKASLSGLKFYPARVGNRPVKQLVQVLYRFVTTSRPAYDSVQTVKDVNAFEVVITGVDETKPTGALELIRSEPAFYIVDGKRTSRDDVSKIPTDKIASVEVFKGETARAKYGDEGKNGVIVITTKPKP
jgi:TonB family protein